MHFIAAFLIIVGLANIENIGQVYPDSTKIVYKNDTLRLKNYDDLATRNFRSNPDTTLKYASEGIDLAFKTGHPEYLSNLYLKRGKAYYYKNDYQQAATNLETAVYHAVAEKDTIQMFWCYTALGKAYNKIGDYPGAIKALLNALKAGETKIQSATLYITYNDLGNVYRKMDNINEALNYYRKTVQILEGMQSWSKASVVYNNIGLIYEKLEDYETALMYHKKALGYNLGNSTFSEALSLNNIGDTYMSVGQYDSAEFYYLKSLEIKEKLNNLESITYTLQGLALTYLAQDKLALAKAYALKNYKIATSINAYSRIENAGGTLAKYYKTVRDYKNALKYYEIQQAYLDSLFSDEKSQEIGRLNATYEMRNVELENQLLRTEKDKSEAIIANQKMNLTITTLVLTFSSILIVGLYFWIKKRNKSNRELQTVNAQVKEQKAALELTTQELIAANDKISSYNTNLEQLVEERTAKLVEANNTLRKTKEELDLFLYRSSHDLRRPLTTLLGLNEVVTMGSNGGGELFSKVMETAGSLDKILNSLMMVSIINSETSVQKLSCADLKMLAKQQIPDSVELIFRCKADLIGSNVTILELILKNCFENSIKFNDKANPKIILRVHNHDDALCLVLEDNGIGISKEVLNHVFDMYFVGTEKSKGNGLGLYIVKKGVEKLGGKIKIESEEGEFTRIEILLPSIDHLEN